MQQELNKRSKVEGITPLDVMELPEPLRTAMNKLMRQGSMTVGELAVEDARRDRADRPHAC